MAEYEVRQQAEEEGKRLELEGCAAEHEGETRDGEYEQLATPIWDILLDDRPGKVDRIMDVIAERCWLKISEGALIDYLRYLKGEGRISPEAQKRNEIYANPYKLGKELYEWIQTAGYCMVKEIKKEE